MKKRYILAIALSAFSLKAFSQKEKGSFKSNPKIPVNTGLYNDKKKRDDGDDYLPPLQLNTQYTAVTSASEESVFKPVKQENSTVSAMDTSSRDEGSPFIVEIEDQVAVDDGSAMSDADESWTSIAGYYSIWDTRTIDPYGIDPKEFDEVLDIELFNREQGRVWSMPLNEIKITSPFAPRWGRMHTGVDLDLNTGDPVYSAFDGIVRVVGWDGGGYGNFVVVRHYNGLETLYGHLSRSTVEPNMYIKAQDMIGLGGSTGHSTGSHLHFETRYEGNAFNPTYVFNFAAAAPIGEHLLLTPSVFNYYVANMENEYGASARKMKHRRVAYTRARSGDTLYGIAQQAGISAERLAKLNGMKMSSTLRAGKRLRIR